MVKLQDILSELLISEALPISVARKYMNIATTKIGTKRLTDLFQKLASLKGATTSKRGDRIYFPITAEEELNQYESPVRLKVYKVLDDAGYTLVDYIKGIARDKLNRDVKVGKILNKLKNIELLNSFNADEARQGKKQKKFIIVFSKHPYDVAGMSTDRGWTSCMNLYTGMYNGYVSKDIATGTFVCYLTKPEDRNLNKPVGRLLVKPFINIKNKRDVVYVPENKVYGTAPKEFLMKVIELLDGIQSEKVGNFTLHSKLYCDSQSDVSLASADIREILKNGGEAQTEKQVISLLNYFGISDYKINDDLSVDVQSAKNINLARKRLKVIPIKFGKVEGSFRCSYNQLTSLKNSPRYIGGDFICDENPELTSLVGGPEVIEGGYYCTHTSITSLEGVPAGFKNTLNVSYNKLLTSLKGAPPTLQRLDATHCALTSLEGGPRTITDSIYDVSANNLTSLKGFPRFGFNVLFYLIQNNLKSLEGIESNSGVQGINLIGTLNLTQNPINDFSHLPKKMTYSLILNGVNMTIEQAKWIVQNVEARIYSFNKDILDQLREEKILDWVGKKILNQEGLIRTKKVRRTKW